MVKLALLLCFLTVSVFGQNYNFSVPEFTCTVEINRDRSLNIDYEIVFDCTSGYSAVDIVDIGFPSEDFSLSDIEAGIDNHQLNRIYYSTYIDNGVEVHLDQHAVYGSDSGRFRFSGVNREMVFLDTEEDDFASMEFSPTWFDGGVLSGQSDFTLNVIFPEGATPDLVRHHDIPFTSSLVDKDGRVVYQWSERRRVDSPYQVGVSFPDDLVDGPLTERPKEPWLSPEALVVVSVFGFIFLFFSFIIFIVVKAVRSAGKRKEQYLPPKLGLEGSGIKRGLTAPMAALLLEEKLDKVFTLIVFGLLKKGKLQLDGHKLKRIGSDEGLRSYEKALLKRIPTGGRDKPIPEDEIKKIFLGMIKELEKRMKEFSLKDTQEYYRNIIESAWKMASEEMTAERAGEILKDRFHWMLADPGYDKRVRGLSDNQHVILPSYMYGYFSGRMSTGGMSLSQACSQVSGALESAAGRTVRNLTSLSRTVTSKTNPVPVSTYRSSGSSGSGCACACACAGCACACAGGGR